MEDLLCLDYESAQRNRKMVKEKLNIEAYVYIENLVKGWPRRQKFPDVVWSNSGPKLYPGSESKIPVRGALGDGFIIVDNGY